MFPDQAFRKEDQPCIHCRLGDCAAHKRGYSAGRRTRAKGWGPSTPVHGPVPPKNSHTCPPLSNRENVITDKRVMHRGVNFPKPEITHCSALLTSRRGLLCLKPEAKDTAAANSASSSTALNFFLGPSQGAGVCELGLEVRREEKRGKAGSNERCSSRTAVYCVTNCRHCNVCPVASASNSCPKSCLQ